MVICQSVPGAICTLKHTDLELYIAAISSFDMDGYVYFGSYQRDLISFHAGKRICSRISIIRVRIKGNMSRRTHAVLPDIIVPYSSYSVRFILSVICLFSHRNCSAQVFADRLFLSRSTINTWIRTYSGQLSRWVVILKEADKKLCDTESATASVPGLQWMLLSETDHSFPKRSAIPSPHAITDQLIPPDT